MKRSIQTLRSIRFGWLCLSLVAAGLAFVSVAGSVSAIAEDVVQAIPSSPPNPAAQVRKKSRGVPIRVKETDGTEALHRFDPKNVIESRYRLKGQPLEVDPD